MSIPGAGFIATIVLSRMMTMNRAMGLMAQLHPIHTIAQITERRPGGWMASSLLHWGNPVRRRRQIVRLEKSVMAPVATLTLRRIYSALLGPMFGSSMGTRG